MCRKHIFIFKGTNNMSFFTLAFSPNETNNGDGDGENTTPEKLIVSGVPEDTGASNYNGTYTLTSTSNEGYPIYTNDEDASIRISVSTPLAATVTYPPFQEITNWEDARVWYIGHIIILHTIPITNTLNPLTAPWGTLYSDILDPISGVSVSRG